MPQHTEGTRDALNAEGRRCPACITTAALVVAGATSPGGLIALVVKKLPAKAGAKFGKE